MVEDLMLSPKSEKRQGYTLLPFGICDPNQCTKSTGGK